MRRRWLFLAALLLAQSAQAQVVGPTLPIYASGGNQGLISFANADGWSATTQALSSLKFLPDTVPQSIPRTCSGYDASGNATTYADSIIVTKSVRFAYPSQAVLNPSRVAMSDYFYSVCSSLGVTNNSTIVAPRPIAGWVHAGDRQTFYGSTAHTEFTVASITARNQAPIAYASCTVSDGTHTNTVAAVGPVKLTSTTDVTPVQGYTCDNDISTITAGQFTVNAKLYPWIGGSASILDTSIAASRIMAPQTFTKSTGSRYFAYANTATGVDASCVASQTAATALALPCLTYVGAVNKCKTTASDTGNCTIRLTWGQTFVNAAATTASAATSEMIIEADPAGSGTAPILQFGAASTNMNEKYVRLRNISLARLGAFQITVTSGGQIALENIAYDASNGSSAISFAASGGVFINGMTPTNALANTLGYIPTTQNLILSRGILMTPGDTTARNIAPGVIVGSKFTTTSVTVSGGTWTVPIFIGFSQFLRGGVDVSALQTLDFNVSAVSNWADIAIVQSMFEYAGAGASPNAMIRICADPAQGCNMSNVLIDGVTMAGAYNAGRFNGPYDNNSNTTVRVHFNFVIRNSILVQENMKGDPFVATSGGDPTDAPLHTGNFPQYYGTGWHDNWYLYADAAGHCPEGNFNWTFSQIYPGLHTRFSCSSTVPLDPLFTAPASTTYNGTVYTVGAGNGDYTLQAGSTAKGYVGVATWPFTLTGAARPATGDSVGAN